jgi:hypothetical protein
VHSAMSALGQKRTSSLFNHLVGAGEQRRRHFEAECFRGLEIDHQLIFGRRLHWQVGWLLALEDAINIASGTSVVIEPVRPVRDQAASGDKSTIRIDRGKLIAGRKCDYLLAVNEGRAASYHDKSAIRAHAQMR